MAHTETSQLTAEEFAEQYADRPWVELVRGEVVELSPGGMDYHSLPSSNIDSLLWTWARQTKRGRVVTNEAGLITSRGPDTVRGADVAFFSYARLPKGKMPESFSTVPPELVVEVLGKGQSWGDIATKVAEYLEMGVDRVWVADAQKRAVHVFRSDAPPARLSEQDTISDPDILPGFACQVSAFFED